MSQHAAETFRPRPSRRTYCYSERTALDGFPGGSSQVLNLSLRQRVAAMGQRSATPCKSEDGLRQQLAPFQVYYNFVLSHASLRQALAEPVPTNGSGSAKVWRPCTPAMAAGLTDHVWGLREVLRFRVPPWLQPQTV